MTRKNKWILTLDQSTIEKEGVRIEDGVPIHTYTKELCRVGSYHNGADKYEITVAMLDEMVINFADFSKNGNRIPICATHDWSNNPENNHGWLLDLWRENDSLYGKIELIGEDAPKLAKVSEVSVACAKNYTDGKGTKYKSWTLLHIALTTDPVVDNLKGWIAASIIDNKEIKMSIAYEPIAEALGISSESINDENALDLILDAIALLKKEPEEEPVSEEAALSLSPQFLKMAKELNEMKLSKLVADGAITPAVKNKLMELFNDKMQLSVSSGNFDTLIDILKENKVISFAEKSGIQVLSLPKSKNKTNILLEDVEKRRQKAGI